MELKAGKFYWYHYEDNKYPIRLVNTSPTEINEYMVECHCEACRPAYASGFSCFTIKEFMIKREMLPLEVILLLGKSYED